jgi:guanylate kinase
MLINKGKIIVISSVSGGGKTTLINRLIQNHPKLRVAVTATSRPPRTGEIHGLHYYFLPESEFDRMIEKNELLEHATVHGNHYGIPGIQVENQINSGVSLILNIDYQGLETVKKKMPESVVSVFLLPPNPEIWETRLRSRGTEDEKTIQMRLEQGKRELEESEKYQYKIVNDDLEKACSELEKILIKEGAL